MCDLQDGEDIFRVCAYAVIGVGFGEENAPGDVARGIAMRLDNESSG